MDALTFIVFGFIAYWSYWSIKHEGVFWIPRTVAALGGLALWIFSIFYLASQINNSIVQVILIAVTGIAIFWISNSISIYCSKMIEKRVGKDPYKLITEKKIKKNPTSEEYSEMLDEIDRLSEK